MRSIRFLLSCLAPKLRWLILAAGCLGALGHLLALSSILLLLLTLAQEVNPALGLPLAVVLGLSRGALSYGEQYVNHLVAFLTLRDIRSRVYEALERLAPYRLENDRQGALISAVTADIETLEVFYAHTLSPLFIAVTVGLAASLMVGLLSSFALAGIYLAGFLLIGCLAPLVHYQALRRKAKSYRGELSELTAACLESIRGSREIVFNRLEDTRARQLAAASERAGALLADGRIRSRIGSRLTALGLALVMLALVLYGALSLRQGQLSLAQTLVGVGLSLSAFTPALSLSELPGNLAQTFASAKRIRDLVEEEPRVREIRDERAKPHSIELRLENISYSYDGESILRDVSGDFPSSGLYAIVGPSGGGKSTLLKLILRHMDPQGGRITLGGEDIRQIDAGFLRQTIAMMGQSTHLFNESIADNMLEAAPQADRGSIHSALRQANAEAFVAAMPAQEETEIALNATNISTGQKQRIGLARVLLRQAPILLLDEPTSNVDTQTEKLMMDAITDYARKHLVILVTHRENPLVCADRILALSDGKLTVKK